MIQKFRSILSIILSDIPTIEFLVLFLFVYLIIDVIILVWFFITPFAVQSNFRPIFGLAMLGYNWGYLVSNCHQMPQRCLIFNGFQMPICSRDVGIYIGCLIGGLLSIFRYKYPRLPNSILILVLSVIPIAADGISQTVLELRESTNELRLLTGAIFGVGLVYYFGSIVTEYARGRVNLANEAKKALHIGTLIVFLILLTAFIVGGNYITMDEAIRKANMNPTFVTYVSKRALTTFIFDPYLGSYNDSVLYQLKKHKYSQHGLWIVYDGELQYQGKFVYFSGGNGNFSLISDLNA